MLKVYFCAIFLFCLTTGFSQELIKGQVYSAEDSTAIYGASVYFDGTSLGVSTGEDGSFSLKIPTAITAPLVVSSIGYQPLILSKINENYSGALIIYLQPSQEQLEAVKIEADPWTREKKLRIFKKEFLGKNPGASKCKIKNEERIRLNYSPSTQTLTAYAEKPLIIINRNLGYKITYKLFNFQVKFSIGSSGLQLTEFTYYEGSSYFEELRKKPKRSYLKQRTKTYKGSFLQFMRCLASQTLEENKFEIYHDRFKVSPYKFFNIEEKGALVEVSLLAEKIAILYNRAAQSGLSAKGPVVIDKLGNHSPPQNLILSGSMSRDRISNLLPLDYNLK